MVALSDSRLTPRWNPLRYHSGQAGFWCSDARFDVAETTRRGGKSEICKRRGVIEACTHHTRSAHPDGLYVFACPTRDQTKQIYWNDLKSLVPDAFVAPRGISEVDLAIKLINGATLRLFGMDRPARVEGQPIDRAFCDEFQAWKPGAYATNIRPALSTIGRPGRGAFVGIPRAGGNPDFKALAHIAKSGTPGWRYHSWTAQGLLSEADLADARRTMDARTFAQEYLAQRIEVQGRVYYTFSVEVNAREELLHFYDPRAPLEVCFDFNTSPGVAAIGQRVRFREVETQRRDRPEVADEVDVFFGEVWIPDGSNTPMVCRKILADWGRHQGMVRCYGDPNGGNRSTSSEGNSDWSLIEEMFGRHFGSRRVDIRRDRRSTKGAERRRINAANSRFCSTDGVVSCLIDPVQCPRLVEDLEDVLVKQGTDGEIDKDRNRMQSHLSDAIAYRAEFLSEEGVTVDMEFGAQAR